MIKCVLQYGDTLPIEFEFENYYFGRGGGGGERNIRVPGEKSLGTRARTNNKLKPHMTPSPGIKLGQLRHPGSPMINISKQINLDSAVTCSSQKKKNLTAATAGLPFPGKNFNTMGNI